MKTGAAPAKWTVRRAAFAGLIFGTVSGAVQWSKDADRFYTVDLVARFLGSLLVGVIFAVAIAAIRNRLVGARR